MLLEIIHQGFIDSLSSLYQIALLLIPVIVLIETAVHFHLMDFLSLKMEPFARSLTLPKEAAFPLLIGIVFGIILGAAIIIDYAKKGHLSPRELSLIAIYLSINHSLFEDNLIFAALGANVFLIMIIRFFLAYIITRTVAYFWNQKSKLSPSANN